MGEAEFFESFSSLNEKLLRQLIDHYCTTWPDAVQQYHLETAVRVNRTFYTNNLCKNGQISEKL